MSLAFCAAPVNNNNNENNENNNNEKNRNQKNNTGIRSSKNTTYKNKASTKINKNMINDDLNNDLDNDNDNYNYNDDDTHITSNLGKFNSMNVSPESPESTQPVQYPHHNLYNQDNMNNPETNVIPNYNTPDYTSNPENYMAQSNTSHTVNNSELLKKLDNILYLLEEQHEEKTNYITEELILYIFLGVFIIYVLDSFVKIGKYVR